MLADTSVADDSLLARLAVAQQACSRLKDLLEEEFTALKSRDLPSFESLQPVKATLLTELSAAVEVQTDRLGEEGSPGVLSAWEAFRFNMLECRDLHRRNELLILRKRDAVRGALQALMGGAESASSVEVYDRLGRVNRNARRRDPYAQA